MRWITMFLLLVILVQYYDGFMLKKTHEISKHRKRQEEVYCNTCPDTDIICNNLTPSNEACAGKCCYQVSIYTSKGRINKRGCYKQQGSCHRYCKIHENSESFLVQTFCSVCNESKCNNETLPVKVYCHSCKKCNTLNGGTMTTRAPRIVTTTTRAPEIVTTTTTEPEIIRTEPEIVTTEPEIFRTEPEIVTTEPSGDRRKRETVVGTVECYSPNCCYTAIVQETKTQEPYARRGCVAPPSNKTLKIIKCSRKSIIASVTREFLDEFPNGNVLKCNKCTNPKDKCNDDEYKPPVMCYDCKGGTSNSCSNIEANTDVKPCASGCCYSATMFSNHGFSTIRNCSDIDNGNNCIESADHTPCKHGLQTVHTGEEVPIYSQCFPCTSYMCNNDTLNEPFKCHRCKRCNTVRSGSMVDCLKPECCYTMYKRDHPYENLYVERGCADWSIQKAGCANLCETLTETHKSNYSEGAAPNCTVCDSTDPSGCNDETYVPEYTCYSCNDTSCFEATAATGNETCVNKCCVSLTTYRNKEGFNNVRGCVPENVDCTRYCENYELEYLRGNKSDAFVHCRTCEGYKCNREKLYEPFECYECNKSDCDPGVVRVACLKSSYCYAAYVNDDEDAENKDYYTIRGCMEWLPVMIYKDACEFAKMTHFKSHWKGEFNDCVTCLEGAKSACNNKTFNVSKSLSTAPLRIQCYKCTNCDVVDNKTSYTPCVDRCCYRATMTKSPDQRLYTVRDCMEMGRRDTCDKTCKYVRLKHRRDYPNGVDHACVTCDSGDSSYCNHEPFYLPKHVLPGSRVRRSIRCYNCTHCNRVRSLTPNIHCRDARCCYSALMRDGAGNDTFYSVRGCADWDPDDPCNDTCTRVEKTGLVVQCDTCKEGDGNECNRKPYTDVKKPMEHAIECYTCSGCNVVDTLSEPISCPKSECCYRALMQTTPTQSIHAKRGCMPGDCNKTCKNVEDWFYKDHAGGVFHLCITCNHNDVDRCNGKPFYPEDHFTKDQPPPGTIKCYECMNCSKVATDTPTVDCRSARCCYTAYLQNFGNQPFYALRGCIRWRRERTCVDTCADLKNDHLWVYPYGNMAKCIPCGSKDSDKCNRYPIAHPKTTTAVPLESTSLMCFHCPEGCYTVEIDTPTVECPAPRCCYTAHVQDFADNMVYVLRGCGQWDANNRCRTTCRDVRNDHMWKNPFGVFVKCHTCQEGDTDECNSRYYEPPITRGTPRPSSQINKCYNCSEDCDEITDQIPVTVKFAECCYIAIVYSTNPDKYYASRGFGSETEPCPDACGNFIVNQASDASLVVKGCSTCTTGDPNGCNTDTYTSPLKVSESVKTEVTLHQVECYNCTQCNTVSSARTIKCPVRCCYITLRTNEPYGMVSASRGCSTQVSNCLRTCTHEQKHHKEKHRDGTLNFCMTCDETEGDGCNGNIYPPESPSREWLEGRS